MLDLNHLRVKLRQLLHLLERRQPVLIRQRVWVKVGRVEDCAVCILCCKLRWKELRRRHVSGCLIDLAVDRATAAGGRADGNVGRAARSTLSNRFSTCTSFCSTTYVHRQRYGQRVWHGGHRCRCRCRSGLLQLTTNQSVEIALRHAQSCGQIEGDFTQCVFASS